MDEKQTNENLAAALGMDVDEIPVGEPVEEFIDDGAGDGDDEGDALEYGDDDGAEELEAKDDQPEAETKAEGEGDTLPYAERTEIKAALAKDGLPEGLIESLSPADLRSYWAKRVQRDEAFSGMKADLKRLKSQDFEHEPDKAEKGGAPTTEPDNSSISAADLSALIEEFGEEEAKQIAGYVTSQVQSATAPLLNALEQMIDTQQQSRLSGVVPDGLEDGWYEQVRGRAIELAQSGMYQEKTGKARQDALFDAALRLEFPDLPSPSEMQRDTRLARQKRNGSASRSGRLSRKAESMSKEDAMTARALAAIEGKSPEEIRRMYP